MEHEKENAREKHVSRRNSRRSSILKESPGRKPLVAMESNHHSRRSLKRVSFADTNTIKEFLATMGASTEWNSTYEAPAVQDSSASMDVTTLGLKSDGLEDDAGSAGQTNLQLETSTFLNQFLTLKPGSSSIPEPASEKEDPLSQSQDNLRMETSTFLNQFLNMNPGSEATTPELGSHHPDEELGQDMLLSQSRDNPPVETSTFLSQFLNLKPGSSSEQPHGSHHHKESGNNPSAFLGTLDVNPSVGKTLDQGTRLPQSDLTQKICADMEMTCPAGQMPKFTGSDMTQKISADMEMTCPAGQMPKFTSSDVTQKISADMEMTCPAGQMPKFTSSDVTQKISADMEMTCPAGQMPKFTSSDVTQKISADMEMTCPAGQMPKFTSSDVTQKISSDMEMTCPAGQIPKLTSSDMTQKISADMEMTCPGGQMVQLTSSSDITQKLLTDMEMTCPAGQIPKLTGSETAQAANLGLELTGPAVGKKRRKSILRNTTTSYEAEAGMPKEERTVMFNLDPEFHNSLINKTDERNDKHSSEHKGMIGDNSSDAKRVSLVGESQGAKTLPVLQFFLREEDSRNMQVEGQQAETITALTSDGSDIGNKETGSYVKGSGKRLQGVSPDESSLKVFLSEDGPKRSLSVTSVPQVDEANKTQNITLELNVTCPSEGVPKVNDDVNMTCHAGQIAVVTGDSTKAEQVDQELSKEQHIKEKPFVSIGESATLDESLDGINLDLENSGDNAETWLHSGLAPKGTPQENSHNVPELKPESKSRRKSLAADAVDSVLPMMSSFMERISMMNHEQSLLEETILKEMTLIEEQRKEMTLQTEDTKVTLHSVGEIEDVGTTSIQDELHEPVEMQKLHVSEKITGHQTTLDDSEGTGTLKLHLTSLEPTANIMAIRDIPQTLEVADTSSKEIKNTFVEEDCLQTSRSAESHETLNKSQTPNPLTERMTEDNMQVENQQEDAEDKNREHDVHLSKEKESIMASEEVTDVSSCTSHYIARPTTVRRSTPSETMAQNILTVSLENSALQINSSTIQHCNMSASQNLTLDNTSWQCESCCATECCIVFQSKNATWTVSRVYDGGRCLSLQHTPLEIDLQLSRCDNHWTIVTAFWKPQPSEIQNRCGRLVMSVLGCRVGAAVTRLSGLVFCEAKEALEQVVMAFNNVIDLILEMKLLATLYLTSFEPDSVKVTLFNLNAHVSVDVTVQVHPPEESPEHPYTLQPSAKVTIGNLRCQTLNEAMGEVSPGPRQLLRLIQAANSIVRNMSC
ncbi:uncharacterized protein LOC122248063 isoform X2 [Penaeus japonicus]|uniref:uncharacterized protein LOC122248063 isoform X2 n=1 Tax=Penaeus japonicus TaxID=27405 RepID=UPI001C70B334|nr:uncharacterized protein LOC122248063 isoform X2 [Penaeus japonicus]